MSDSVERMNVLFLMTDQHRVDTLGCYGNTVVSTPNIDRLAAEGTRFDRCYTPTAICAPARASLLTGSAPFRHGLLGNPELGTGARDDLAPGQFTFSGALRDVGYRLGLYGKWHVGDRRSAADHGFEGPDFPGWRNPVDHPDYLAYLREHDLPPYAVRDAIHVQRQDGHPGALLAARLDQPVEATFEHYLATRTIEALRRYHEGGSAKGPFFLATHFFGPHLPYVVPDSYFDRYDPDKIELPRSAAETFAGKPPVQRHYSTFWGFDSLPPDVSRQLIAAYWGYVTLIDEQIGRILDELDRLGLAGETAVFFTADHGEFTGAHRLHSKGPAMYEDIYRIPGIVRVPGAPRGQVRDEFVTLIDCTATVLDLAGCDAAPAVDSRSLVPLIHGGQPDWPREVVTEFHGLHFSYSQRMIRDDRYKLVINPESCNELYDLRADPDELHNRYHHPELRAVRDRLFIRLRDLLRDRGDGFHHWMSTMDGVGTPPAARRLGDERE